MLKQGTGVKIKESKNHSDIVNAERVGRTGIVSDIRFPFGLHTMYEVTLDDPIENRWGIVDKIDFYDWDDCLEVLK